MPFVIWIIFHFRKNLGIVAYVEIVYSLFNLASMHSFSFKELDEWPSYEPTFYYLFPNFDHFDSYCYFPVSDKHKHYMNKCKWHIWQTFHLIFNIFNVYTIPLFLSSLQTRSRVLLWRFEIGRYGKTLGPQYLFLRTSYFAHVDFPHSCWWWSILKMLNSSSCIYKTQENISLFSFFCL